MRQWRQKPKGRARHYERLAVMEVKGVNYAVELSGNGVVLGVVDGAG